MRAVTLISFWLAGAMVGIFVGSFVSFTSPPYVTSSDTNHTFEQVGLGFLGSCLGLGFGALILFFKRNPPKIVPVIGFAIAMAFLGLRVAREAQQSVLHARQATESAQNHSNYLSEAKNGLDELIQATGWQTRERRDRDCTFEQTITMEEAREKLMSLGATDYVLIPQTPTYTAIITRKGHKFNSQITPMENGGTQVLVSFLN